MKFIKEAESAVVNNQRVRQGLFECPVCTEHVVKRISHGKVNKTCGSKECKSKALSAGQVLRDGNGDARRSHGLSGKKHYVSFRKMWKQIISIDSNWNTLDEFVADMFREYEEIKIYAVTGRTKLLKKDDSLPHSRSNSYFDASNTTKEAIRLDAMSWPGQNTVKLGSELSANFEIVNIALINAIESSDMFESSDFIGISPRTKTVYKLTNSQSLVIVDEISKLKGYTASDKVYIVSSPYIKNGEILTGYKLGISHDIEKRLSTLRNANPNEITLVFGSDKIDFATTIEKYLHSKYSYQNIHREWFELSEEDIKSIVSDLSSNNPVAIAIEHFNNISNEKLEEAKRLAVKKNLLDSMKHNLEKLDKAYMEKHEAEEFTEKHIEPVNVVASENDKSGFKCKPYTIPSKLKPVYQFKLDGTFVNKFDGVTIAQSETGIGHIGSVCNGKRKHAGGFLWSFNDSCEPVEKVRKSGVPIEIFDMGILIDILDTQSEVVKKYEVSNSTLKRRLEDGKPIGDLTFIYQK